MLGSLPLRRRDDRPRRFRRGVFLLPSLFTIANLFCGYACVVYATRADFDTAALFIGIAMVLDTLDGFFARLTNSSTAFGVQLDSLADVVSFGMAPAILAFTWGLWPLKRLGWAAGFIYVTAAAMRLARFNIQSSASTDKRYFVGLPSPAAGGVIAATVYLFPYGIQEQRDALPALAMVLIPAFLMVSTIRFRSVKAIDVGWHRSVLRPLPRRRGPRTHRLASPHRPCRAGLHLRLVRLRDVGRRPTPQTPRRGPSAEPQTLYEDKEL